MWKLYLVVALIWLALLPPFFTGGDCNREFEQVSALLNTDARKFRTVASARKYWEEKSVPVSVITRDECEVAKPRYLSDCPRGTLVYATVPVNNLVCRVYRDDAVRVQLHYGEKGHFQTVAADMKPDKYLWIPLADARLYWGR